jgi:hypothetical protein
VPSAPPGCQKQSLGHHASYQPFVQLRCDQVSCCTALAHAGNSSDCCLSQSPWHEQWLKPFSLLPSCSDVQYADIPDGHSFHGVPRYYRNSLVATRRAVAEGWEPAGVQFGIHFGDILDGFQPKVGCLHTYMSSSSRPLGNKQCAREQHMRTPDCMTVYLHMDPTKHRSSSSRCANNATPNDRLPLYLSCTFAYSHLTHPPAPITPTLLLHPRPVPPPCHPLPNRTNQQRCWGD